MSFQRLFCALAACLVVTGWAAPARAAGGGQGGLLLPVALPSLTTPPPGFGYSARDAVRRASALPAVDREAAKGPGLVARVFVFGAHDWQVSFYRGSKEVLRVELDGKSGRLVGAWTGPQIEWPLARGAHGPHARRLHAFLILSGVLFLVPFF